METCTKGAEVAAMRDVILEISKTQAQVVVVQAQHAEMLKTLAAERIENVKFKAKIGGVVIATAVCVSSAWALVLAAIQLWKH